MPYPGINPWELTFNRRKRRSRELGKQFDPENKGFYPSAPVDALLAEEESERAKRLYGVDLAIEDTSIYVYPTIELQKNKPPFPLNKDPEARELIAAALEKYPLVPEKTALESISVDQSNDAPTRTKKQNFDILTNAITAIIADKGFTQTGKKLTQYRDAGQRDIPIDFV